MPGGNRRGPLGEGPKTGRGLGYCAGQDESGYTTSLSVPGLGRRFRWGERGRGGCGWRNRFNADFRPGRGRKIFAAPALSTEQEVETLKAQAVEMQNAFREIQDRLDQLEV